MIKYNLICPKDHEFEAWFSKGSDFDSQVRSSLVICPICGSKKIEKAIMAPNISTSRKKAKIKETRSAKKMALMNDIAEKIREEISANCDDVGDKFADEARSIHYGEKPIRGIYGTASPREAVDLAEEGITAHPLPDILAPKPLKKLN